MGRLYTIVFTPGNAYMDLSWKRKATKEKHIGALVSEGMWIDWKAQARIPADPESIDLADRVLRRARAHLVHLDEISMIAVWHQPAIAASEIQAAANTLGIPWSYFAHDAGCMHASELLCACRIDWPGRKPLRLEENAGRVAPR